ncbi:daunorubicin resistance ABC transporter ATPase subunit [Caldicellulosiruptor hydrothermalis 108]|uniref:Daunorubicin resistance ABC transporter ATPase subunit n=1 Tax=Caldicellulosiruptor hydrothermalis (strain DSM 18901 / VKM B-2411 / 108) TaxID=632292 RepID=E4QAK9_CALH1|nr:daunorubicin resistance protein DrrA family ABC transporter ATP-binding protein [Caldicellulosiruptor hydrothermalis]ADQ05934.1 daunorubicin resistance ABC transporter ATPase subunit [Caldicellulosiruptor hydrothermalis 108]
MTKARSISTEFAIETYNLIKKFGENRAVDGVNLKVRSGSIYCVLGPNGAGKTTTIKMLATILRPDGGWARIFGFDVVKDAYIVRQLISVTGQYASLDESLSGLENLILIGQLLGLNRKEARRRANELLEEFELIEAAKLPLKKLSGGMKRRVDIAASLIVQKPLIFLDEPTTGLDPRTRNQMWNTIRRLVKTGSTVLLTTQYLQEAEELADQIAVINHGKVVAEGTVEELKKSIGNSTLQLKVKNPTDLETARKIVESLLKTRSNVSLETGSITAPMTDTELIADLVIALRESKIHIAELNVQQPTLDEVFLAIIGQN